MNPLVYSVLHVLAVLLLSAYTFQAFANPIPERRRQIAIRAGIASLVVLVAGVGLLHKQQLGFPNWVVIKLAAWLVLSALGGLAFRRPQKTGTLTAVAILALVAALYAVYFRPFA